MIINMKPFLLTLFLFIGCSPVLVDLQIQYRDGVEIRIYSNRAEMIKVLPPIMRALENVTTIHGWYDREHKIIYSIDDPRVLEHEMKHYREPSWVHPVGCVYLPC